MRILHVVRGLESSSGVTRAVIAVAEEQARRGSRVSVYSVDNGRDRTEAPNRDLVESISFPLSAPPIGSGLSVRFARAVNARVGAFDFVHVHAVWNFPTFWAMRAALRAGVPYMVAPHGSFEPWALNQSRLKKQTYGQLLEMPLVRKAACLQALTAAEAGQIRACGIERPVAVVPNGMREVPGAREQPASLGQQLGLPANTRTILFLSRLHPKKGLDILIEAFVQVAAGDENVTLVIAGQDHGTGYRATVERMIAARGLGRRCVLIGEVMGSRKDDVLRGADVFVLPSHSEGLPVAVMEAMSAGVPVVITRGCNLPEVESWSAGHVVDADPAAVCAALQSCLGDRARARAMGANGRRLVRERFSWDKIVGTLAEVYETHSGGRHGSLHGEALATAPGPAGVR